MAPPAEGSSVATQGAQPDAENDMLQFAPFASQIAPSLWTVLAAIKIDRLQLSEELVPIAARYGPGRVIVDRTTGDTVHLPVALSLDGKSLEVGQPAATAGPATSSVPSSSSSPAEGSGALFVQSHGVLKNFNTIEEFKKADKAALLQQAGDEMLRAIIEDATPLPKLTSFILLTFADLKKYKFFYWFAFPALLARPSWRVQNGWQSATDVLGGAPGLKRIETELSQRGTDERAFFLVHPDGTLRPVMDFASAFAEVDEGERMVGFIDPSPKSTQPGWPLRNLLTLLAVRFGVRSIRILCWKDELGSATATSSKSVVARILCDGSQEEGTLLQGISRLPLAAIAEKPESPAVVGWERNAAGKLIPKAADLGPMMDPTRLADQAVDLNLKLMRWRILPEINLERVQSTKCLLLGAGTLGCYVARTLLGWGVRHITMVDSSTVSFSNPVRQPLFDFADCLEGGKPKAQCAADALRRIYPGVTSRGYKFNIPMPGHPIPASSLEQTAKDVRLLEELFDEHDVVYLLMDSRESRWLPTVLGAVKGKLVMNAALGFDGFLAMRHGASPEQHAQYPGTERLGCYFCNDIVAPTDSLTDRTLDQMCTVTRPGLAAVASALLVELTVSLLQHPRGSVAPAYDAASSTASKSSAEVRDGKGSAGQGFVGGAPATNDPASSSSSILGHLPHQLRGTLYSFHNLLIHGPAYDRCTACSPTVLAAYTQNGGFDIVQQACNDEQYLKSLTGLDKLYDATNDIEVDWSDEDDGIEGRDDSEGELL